VSFSDPGKEKQEGFSSQFSGHASDHEYDSRDAEFAAAVAAAAFETSRTKIKSRKDETTTGFQSSRRFSNMEMKDAGKFLL